MSNAKKVFVPTREQRNTICSMVASKWTPEMISEDLGISLTILKKHFRDELENGEKQVRARAIFALAEEGFKRKSVSALKALIAITVDSSPKDQDGKEDHSRQAPAMRLGKKQTQKLEAETANQGVFATPKPPSSKAWQ